MSALTHGHVTTYIVIISLILLAGLILFYISGRKKRKRPYYSKAETFWEVLHPDAAQKTAFTIYLIGDAGAPSLVSQEPTLELLESQLALSSENSIIFFLGDNIYPKGMPPPENPKYTIAEKRLLEQLKILKKFKGKAFFISGNHDWNKGRKGGYDAMMRQQKYIDDYFKNETSYLPRNGCQGPVEMSINDFICIVVINTQWWVHGGKKPIGKKDGCNVDNEHEFFLQLEDILERNKHKKIIVIGHHPMYSKAYHGGNFGLKQHLFPLTDVNKKMYVPIPVLGSLYPIYRKYIGSKEDMSHPKYRNLRHKLISIFKKYDNLVYAAGHDHNLQYIKKHNQHYIVSGAGSKTTYVQKGRGAFFTHTHKGFFRLDYYLNGDLWLEAWEPGDTALPGKLMYRKELFNNDKPQA